MTPTWFPRPGRGPANPGVVEWLGNTPANALWTSVLVLGELRRGVESLRRRDPQTAELLDRWLGDHRAFQADRVLPIDEAVAERWGRINVPDPVPPVDGLLAATALVHGMTLVTRNTRDVVRTGVTLVDPFTPYSPSALIPPAPADPRARRTSLAPRRSLCTVPTGGMRRSGEDAGPAAFHLERCGWGPARLQVKSFQ